MKKRYILRTSLIVVAVILSIVGFFVMEQYYRLNVSNFRSKNGKEHSYKIYPGTTIDSLFAMLSEDYYIGSKRNLHIHARRMVFNSPEPGYYVFPEQLGDRELITRLKLGLQTPINIRWNNTVRTREELAAKVSARLMMDSATLITYLEDEHFLKQYDMNKETSRCLFIPNTYQVYWTITPEQLFHRMKQEYDAFWNEQRRHKADSIGLSPVEVSIIASIVESETYKRKEQPYVASLYLNRIRKGMPLQACPTVKYALGDFSIRRVLNRHLKVDSPYNTYKYKGLPPGPIRCAEPETMDIVLNAPKTNYLFMCANPNMSGTHIFSASFSNHSSAARGYHKIMNEKHIK